MAETKATADLAFDAFVESYAPEILRRAADCLSKDRDALLAVYDFSSRALENPADDQPDRKHLRHSAPPHDPIKGLLSNKTALAIVFKLVEGAPKKLAAVSMATTSCQNSFSV